MTGRMLGNVGRRAGVVMGLATLGVGIGAAPAFAATTGTSQATANAVGGTVLNTGTCAVGSPTAPSLTPPAVSGPCTNQAGQTVTNPAGTLLTASVLTQAAVADNTGTSAACAGASGTGGGMIQVGPNLQCAFNTATPGGGGVNLLGGLLKANAVFATCTDDLTAGPKGMSTTADLTLGNGLSGLGLLGTLTQSAPVAGPNGSQVSTVSLTSALGVNLGNLLTITTNNVDTTTTPGVVKVTALDIKVLPGISLLGTLGLTGVTNGLEVSVGTVSCGLNAALAGGGPAFPVKGLPIAGGVLALAGGAAYLGRRRLMGVRA